jgi:putative salt-induced outer membrane protein YdiY
MRKIMVAVCVLSGSAGWLAGDVVTLKNGDRLTGTVVSLELKQLKIATAMAGDVTIALDNIVAFQTDGPVALVQSDGTVVRMRIVKYENGQFTLAPAAPSAAAPATSAGPTPAPSARVGTAPAAAPAAKTVAADQVARIGPAQKTWKGNVIAGAIISRGNTDSESFNAGFELGRRGDVDRILIQGDYVYSRQKDESTGEESTTTDRWSNQDKYDYFLSQKWYAYAGTRFEHDGVANLNLRATPGAGAGYQWVETDRTKFSTELGASWVYEEYSHPSDSRDFLAARLAWHLGHKLSSNVELIHNFEILPDVTDWGTYVVTTDAGVRLRVIGHLFTEAKVLLSYNSKPAEDKDRLDEQFRLNLGYEF